MPATAARARANADLDLLGLGELGRLTEGSPAVRVGLIDGPVVADHPDLAGATIRSAGPEPAFCARGSACAHGTFVAGILVARRGSPAPAICPGVTLVVRPIFGDPAGQSSAPTASPDELARAILDCVEAGVSVINLSAAVGIPTTRGEAVVREALDVAAARQTLVVAAAGNQSTLGSSEITRHPGVVPVVAVDRTGRPMDGSNVGRSIGLRGLGAPGRTTSLGTGVGPVIQAGTSVAAAFVTGAVALLLSLVPGASASDVRRALRPATARRSVVPPLLDAQAAHARLVGQRR